MKLLIVTQAVDSRHSNLGFFHRWIEEFAKHVESVQVICLWEGAHALPHNVTVHSLGKERGASRLAYLWRFYRLVWTLRKEYDAVLVHMNPEYVVLGGLLWRLWGKRVGLWYMHRSVTLRLRIATLLAHHIFTGSRESYRLSSSKCVVLGHGIDTSVFVERTANTDGSVRLVTAGRFSDSKGVREMVEAAVLLRERGISTVLMIAGAALTPADVLYEQELRTYCRDMPFVSFLGSVSHDEIPKLLARADIFLNLSNTGSLDKAVLEALAAGVPAISSNDAFKTMLEPHALFVPRDPAVIADAVERLVQRADTAEVVVLLRDEVRLHHSLERLAPAIMQYLSI